MNVTLILTNYKRPDDLNTLVFKFKHFVSEIWVWNNAGIGPGFDIDAKVFTSPINMKCIPRWWLASQVTTDFVCVMDDDLKVHSAEKVIEICKQRCAEFNHVIGISGKRLTIEEVYSRLPDVYSGYVDILKGQFWFLRPEWITDFPTSNTCDDIQMSSMVLQPKFVDIAVRTQFDFLASNEHSLCQRPNHYAEREYYRRQEFDN